MIDWSYSLLDDPQKQLFRRLLAAVSAPPHVEQSLSLVSGTRLEIERLMAQAQSRPGESEFADAWAVGMLMGLSEAIDVALARAERPEQWLSVYNRQVDTPAANQQSHAGGLGESAARAGDGQCVPPARCRRAVVRNRQSRER